MNMRSQASLYVARLSPGTRSELLTQLILGDFDWMDWFEDKPTREYLRALYVALQAKELAD